LLIKNIRVFSAFLANEVVCGSYSDLMIRNAFMEQKGHGAP